MSAEPLPGDGPADPAPAPFRPSPTVRPGPRRLTPVRSVPPPPTTPMVRPGRHAAPDPVDGPAPSVAPVAPPAPAPPAPAPRPAPPTPEADAARRVREAWEEVGPQVDELADWFAALLFSLDPGSRALFPARVTEPASRLLRSLVLAMSTVDRPADLAALLEPLVREHRALEQFLATVDLADPAQRQRLRAEVAELREHIAKEEDGLFPASLTGLDGEEWDAAMAAWREAHPGEVMAHE
jgi:hypothetical protein